MCIKYLIIFKKKNLCLSPKMVKNESSSRSGEVVMMYAIIPFIFSDLPYFFLFLFLNKQESGHKDYFLS